VRGVAYENHAALTLHGSLVAQIEALGNSEGLWPKGLYLNLKADELMRNVDAFAGEVEVSSAIIYVVLK
jgi:hypothetical protein